MPEVKNRILRAAGGNADLLAEWLTRDGHEEAEAAWRESASRFRVTFEQAAVGVAHSSLDGRLLLMNQKLCDILGYSPEEILTKTYQEVTHPEDLVAELEYARRLLAGEIKTAS